MKEDMRRTSRASRARRAQQRKRRNRRIALTLCVMFVVLAASIGGTVAWLTDKTGTITNTFTAGDIDITLTETGTDTSGNKNYKFVPGDTLSKDPTVTVEAGSEACWLFVKVEEANWPEFKEADGTTRKVSYAIADSWTALTDVPGVYYREVPAATADTDFAILKDNVVTVSNTLTKTEVNTVISIQPKLTFTAYAVQKAGINTVAEAWAAANPTTTP